MRRWPPYRGSVDNGAEALPGGAARRSLAPSLRAQAAPERRTRSATAGSPAAVGRAEESPSVASESDRELLLNRFTYEQATEPPSQVIVSPTV